SISFLQVLLDVEVEKVQLRQKWHHHEAKRRPIHVQPRWGINSGNQRCKCFRRSRGFFGSYGKYANPTRSLGTLESESLLTKMRVRLRSACAYPSSYMTFAFCWEISTTTRSAA